MFYLYILKSLKDKGYYIGICESTEDHLIDHNKGKTKSIKHRIPFELFYREEYNTSSEARKREIFLKKTIEPEKSC